MIKSDSYFIEFLLFVIQTEQNSKYLTLAYERCI